MDRSSLQEVLCKKGVLRIFTKFTGKHLCQSHFFNILAGLRSATSLCNFIKKETLAQVFSYEFCEIFMNNFFYRTPPVAGSEWISAILLKCKHMIFCLLRIAYLKFIRSSRGDQDSG